MEEQVNTTEAEVAVTEPEKLSLRDALEVAIETHTTPEPEPVAAPVVEEVKPEPVKEYDGPAEFTKEEREMWMQIQDEKQKAPHLRLHQSRLNSLKEIRQEAAELKHLKELANTIEPYIKAQGIKDPPAVAMQKAVAMWKEFEHGDPKKAALAYLQAKGVNPAELSTIEEDGIDSQLSPVLQKINVLEQKLTQQEHAKLAETLNGVWKTFESTSNAAGAPKYVDITGNSESALRLASQVGSLVGGQTELSKQFIAQCQSRYPDLTHTLLLEKAYEFCGGRIIDTPAPKTEDPQEHLKKSNRAAASVPGRGSSGLATSPVKKFKSTREAAAYALEQLNGKT